MQRLVYVVIALIVAAQLTVTVVVAVRPHASQKARTSLGAAAPNHPVALSQTTPQTATASPAASPVAAASAAPAPAPPTLAVAVATSTPAATLSAPSSAAAPSATAVAASPSAPAEPQRYTVRSGDSLSLLAQRFGVSEPILAALNDLDPGARLAVGQLLYIPAPGAADK